MSVRLKVRWVDPEVAVAGAAVPLSKLSGDHAELVSRHLRRTPDVVHLRVA